jgi:hypothetical protein
MTIPTFAPDYSQRDIYLYVKYPGILRCADMEGSAIKRLEEKLDAVSEFLEDVFLTKEEEELLDRANRIMAEEKSGELHKVI